MCVIVDLCICSSLDLSGGSQSAGSGSGAWARGLGGPAAGERSRRDVAPPRGAGHGLVFVLHVCIIFIISFSQNPFHALIVDSLYFPMFEFSLFVAKSPL